jgi:transcriptional regulator with XRE-family HTH domain
MNGKLVNLKRVRKERGKTQEEAAKDLGIKLATYRAWEQQKYAPRSEKLRELASYLNCSTDYLFGITTKNIAYTNYHQDVSVAVDDYMTTLEPHTQARVLESVRELAATEMANTMPIEATVGEDDDPSLPPTAMNIKKLRAKFNLTAATLADFVHVPISSIEGWEEGNSAPTEEIVSRITKHFDILPENITERGGMNRVVRMPNLIDTSAFEGMSPDESVLISLFRTLNVRAQDMLIKFTATLLYLPTFNNNVKRRSLDELSGGKLSFPTLHDFIAYMHNATNERERERERNL